MNEHTAKKKNNKPNEGWRDIITTYEGTGCWGDEGLSQDRAEDRAVGT